MSINGPKKFRYNYAFALMRTQGAAVSGKRDVLGPIHSGKFRLAAYGEPIEHL
jgi:hypothetical protein